MDNLSNAFKKGQHRDAYMNSFERLGYEFGLLSEPVVGQASFHILSNIALEAE